MRLTSISDWSSHLEYVTCTHGKRILEVVLRHRVNFVYRTIYMKTVMFKSILEQERLDKPTLHPVIYTRKENQLFEMQFLPS